MLLRTYCKQYGFPLVTVRGTNVYGARQQLFKIIPRSVIYVKMGKKIELHGGGVAVKSYIHIRDISHGELAVLDRGTVGQIYNLSPDQGVAVRTVVEVICERMKKSLDQAATMVGERPGQDAAYVIDSSKARHELGWAPKISLKDGLSDVIEWVEKYWNAISKETLEYQHRA